MAQPTARNHAQRGNHKHYARMSILNPQRYVVPAAVLTQSKLVPINTVISVSTAVLKISVTRPRQVNIVVNKTNLPPKRHIDHSPSPKVSTFPPKVTAVKAPMGNPQHALKDKEVIDSGCLRHMTWNMSYLSDFEELNGGYVAFGGNPKGGKISRKGKIRTGKLDFDDVYFVNELKFNLFSVSQMCDKKNGVLFTDTECLVLSLDFKLPDENQVLLRVPRENNMYNVNLKNIVLSGNLTCLFAKATLDEFNLWHRRLGHINFKTMNTLVKDAAFDEKESEFEERKPESKVNVSPSSSAQSKKHDDKTKREAKGKSHVESLTGYRNLSAEFEDFSDNNINEDNADELEDITYSDDKDNVGADADFNNLETSITKKDRIFISQDKYVAEILKKFNLTNGKSASTPIDTEKPLLKDPDGEDVDVHTYRSMIGSLMYLTSSRPDIMFAVCACACFQVTPKAVYLHAVKRIFRYLKGKPHLVLWYPKDSTFDLVAYLDSDYAGASLDRKSTTGGYKKKVVVTEATIREALCLDDAKGIECLPNEDIFVELARMGEPHGMSLVRQWNLLSSVYLQVERLTFQRDLSLHSTKYTSPALTQKVFANMRWVGKGFSGVDTPLFEGMLVAQEVGKDVDEGHAEDVNVAGVIAEGVADDVVPIANDAPSIPSPTPPTPPPQPSQDQPSTSQIDQALEITKLKQKVKKLEMRNKLKVLKLRRLKMVGLAQRINTLDKTVMDDVSKQAGISTNIDADEDVVLEDAKDVAVEKSTDVEDNANIQGRKAKSQAKIYKIDLEHAKKIITEVVTVTSDTITAASTTIIAADVPIHAATIDAAPILTAAPSRRRKGSKEPKPLKKQAQIEQDEKCARELEAEMNKNIDWDEFIDHVQRKQKEDKAVKRYQALKKKPHTKAQARKNMMIYLRNVAGFKMDYFKGMTYDDIRLIFERHFNSNVPFLQKTKEHMDKEDSRALKRLNESQEDKAAKKQKLDEEVEELKRHLQIVPNDEDDVYTEATPLARKVPVIDYEIYNENNKPYYKIKRADGLHQLYLSFLSLLRNFDREDLEALWSLIVPNDEDDVYTEATPLARKVPVIDYEIYNENNKPYYKIKRADGLHQLYLSFLSLLRNFDREDLEALWSLVKERFATTKPKNFFDDFLLITLGAMFEKLDIHAQIKKNQRSVHGHAKVKS
nr:uncharacterized mitochondrial protein AtMg00810-like [Tanacetum cinerariifolium]